MLKLTLIALLMIADVIAIGLGSQQEAFDWYDLPAVKGKDFKEMQFDQAIDHVDKGQAHNRGKLAQGTFKQRYWVNDQYVKVTNPDEVVKHGDLLWLAICGENKCSQKDGHMVEH